jgi:hypothetical protein
VLQVFEILEIVQYSNIKGDLNKNDIVKRKLTSREIAHFQIAPVAAANKALLSVFCKRSCNGRRPKYFLTRSRISLSSAH